MPDQQLAKTTTGPKAARIRTWTAIHSSWFRGEEGDDAAPVFPLTAASVRAVVASLKQGHYRSAENYVSDAKDEHTSRGFPWTEQLARAARNAVRSSVRGQGAAHQAAPLPLERV